MHPWRLEFLEESRHHLEVRQNTQSRKILIESKIIISLHSEFIDSRALWFPRSNQSPLNPSLEFLEHSASSHFPRIPDTRQTSLPKLSNFVSSA